MSMVTDELRPSYGPPPRKPKKIANLCSVCERDFGGLKAFDMHRVGNFEDGRSCLSDDEMRAKGMYINKQGRWSQPENGRSERLG